MVWSTYTANMTEFVVYSFHKKNVSPYLHTYRTAPAAPDFAAPHTMSEALEVNQMVSLLPYCTIARDMHNNCKNDWNGGSLDEAVSDADTPVLLRSRVKNRWICVVRRSAFLFGGRDDAAIQSEDTSRFLVISAGAHGLATTSDRITSLDLQPLLAAEPDLATTGLAIGEGRRSMQADTLGLHVQVDVDDDARMLLRQAATRLGDSEGMHKVLNFLVVLVAEKLFQRKEDLRGRTAVSTIAITADTITQRLKVVEAKRSAAFSKADQLRNQFKDVLQRAEMASNNDEKTEAAKAAAAKAREDEVRRESEANEAAAQRKRKEAAEAAALREEVTAAEAVAKAAVDAEQKLKREAAEAKAAEAKAAKAKAEAAKAKAVTAKAEAEKSEAELAASLQRMKTAGVNNLSQGPCAIM